MLTFTLFVGPLALPAPLPRRCSTSACDQRRSSGSADFSLPKGVPQLLWSEPHALLGGISCSSDGALSVCASGDGGVAAFNHSGVVWHVATGEPPRKQLPWPPLVVGSGSSAVAASFEGLTSSRTLALRSRPLGGLSWSSPVSVGAGLGTAIFPRSVGGDDGLLLAMGDEKSPLVYVRMPHGLKPRPDLRSGRSPLRTRDPA